MHIFAIIKPGCFLDYEDREWSGEIETILLGLEIKYYEANLALCMFLDSRQRDNDSHSREQWEAERKRRKEIRCEVESRYDNPHDRTICDEIDLKSEILFRNEQWQSGKLPKVFEHSQPILHARAFLYALDSFDKFLKILRSQPSVPSNLEAICSQLATAFPDLRKVRNTSQHMEDRIRGLGAGKNPQPLEKKVVNTQLIKSYGTAIFLDCLLGNKFGNTMADGNYGEVDISPASMEALQSIFQEILNSFNWKGPKNHIPDLKNYLRDSG